MTASRSDAAPPSDADAFRATLDGLYRRRRFGIAPGLDVIRSLLDGLGHPERAYPAIHVTGSKGKGSVATMAAAILTAHGVRTGLFTSPHLESYRERLRLDGRPIDPAEVVDGIDRVARVAAERRAAGTIDREPTFFEVTTALALDWFARERVRAAVVEVGIGGRLDATNVLASRVGVVTTIELEHTELLGATHEAIASEKAGILHAGMTGIVGELPAAALAAVRAAASREGMSLWQLGSEVRVDARTIDEDGQRFSLVLPGRTIDAVAIPLQGRFQPGNAALAVAAVARFADATGLALDDGAIRSALAHLVWPGRLERVGRRPDRYYDVAHTPESARAVAQSLGEIYPLIGPESSAIVFGCLRGKNVRAILDALAPLASTLVLVPVRSERALPPAEIRPEAIGRFPRVVLARSATEGERLARAATAPTGFTLVVGSDYLIGELLRAAHGGNDEPDLSDPGVGPPPEAPAGPTPRPASPSEGR
jgi:dihydrofolate synthase / folylpolyglutamate synthase